MYEQYPLFIKCFRESDNREIYLRITASQDSVRMKLMDALMDAKFVIKDSDNSEYLWAKATNKFCYLIEFKDYHVFVEFIKSNYLALQEIKEKNFKKTRKKK